MLNSGYGCGPSIDDFNHNSFCRPDGACVIRERAMMVLILDFTLLHPGYGGGDF
ncbi:hypothetical protein [Celerinatantimonas sp. YJH-8]|uniref:hypothetical protein n=1 Tax=Celerinatantimonas sp. YJH-8 TaxID=3228714 RepID=UPI0038C2293E